MITHSVLGGNNFKLSVKEFGNSLGKPIVFLHGINQSYESFEKQFTHTSLLKYRLIVPDLRGHGDSQTSENIRDFSDSSLWADDIHSIITQLSLIRVNFVAWSYGGYVLLDYITKYGQDNVANINFVSAAVVLTKTLDMVGDGLLSTVRPMMSKNEDKRIEAIKIFLQACFYDKPTDVAFKELFQRNSRVNSFVRKGMFTRVLDYKDTLSNLSCDILVSYGEYDTIILPSMSEYLINQLSVESKVSVYEKCGHMPFVEHDKRYNRELEEFIS